jgi:uncharacterized protein YdeI (YjbR/CyaY-like superfamily)
VAGLARPQPRHLARDLAGHLEEGQRTAVPAYDDIVEEALAFGWVDSQPKTVDGQRSARLLTPRKPGSNWSRLNKQRAERLLAAGLMQPAGLAAVAAARARGHWNAFPRSARRAILEWIGNARTSATRQARIGRTVSDAARGIRANQWRQPKRRGPAAD